MATGVVAALVAALSLGLVEGLGRFYPARETWWRLRRQHGRRAVWGMRKRFEAAAEKRAPRILAFILFVLMVAWVASASLLDKRWHEVLLDVTPYAIVDAALLLSPYSLRRSAERMKKYEEEAGDDPEKDLGDGEAGGPQAIAL
jgi:hypothetical protein